MKRWVLTSALVVGLGGGVMALCAHWMSDEQKALAWTSTAPEAVAELEAGFEELHKLYFSDAISHFERALKLDPENVMAKLFLAELTATEAQREQRFVALAQADLSTLTPRERFLVRNGLVRNGHSDEVQETLVDDFLKEFPQDPFGLSVRCDLAWRDQQWDTAESCYRRLWDIHPNWVMAINRLGYIAMARGRFSEAEEHFMTYRYLAPDQANPYESMGELLTLLGRYDEAETALHQAIEIKSDFCEAYAAATKLHIMSGDVEAARQALQDLRQVERCSYYEKFGFFCTSEAWIDYVEGDFEGGWQKMQGTCLENRKGFDLLAHRLALITGREEEGAQMEAALHAHFDHLSERDQPIYVDYYLSLMAHMAGVRYLFARDYGRAVESFQEVDKKLSYWGGDRVGFKLYNRMNLLRALQWDGQEAEALAVKQNIDAVNPRVMAEFRPPDLESSPN